MKTKRGFINKTFAIVSLSMFFIACLFAMFAGTGLTQNAWAEPNPATDFIYYVDDLGLACIEDYTGISKVVVVPATINGKPVGDVRISYKDLTSLDVSACSSLRVLVCSFNHLTTLTLSKHPKLRYFDCTANSLSSLDLTGAKSLKELHCGENKLRSLNISDSTVLSSLDCSYNNLTQLNISKNTAITHLGCTNNKLKTLDASKISALKALACYENKLKSLNLAGATALEELDCSDNKLTALNLEKNKSLKILDCRYNNITKLSLKNNKEIEKLRCYYNCIPNSKTRKSLVSKFGKSNVLPQYFTVKFNPRGGKHFIIYKNFEEGVELSEADFSSTSRKGFIFKGWYTSKSGGKKTVSTIVKSNKTYYAHWELKKGYTKIKFNSQGGLYLYPKAFKKNSKIGKLPSVEKNGYRLKGWYTKKKGGKKITKNTRVGTRNFTYYAHWKKG